MSEAEASIAAPFTYTKPSIACIPTLLKEGRAALVTSFGMAISFHNCNMLGLFKYMAAYAFVQTLSVAMLYYINSDLGDYQYLFADLAVTSPTTILMGYTDAVDKLVREHPPAALLSRMVLLSVRIDCILHFL